MPPPHLWRVIFNHLLPLFSPPFIFKVQLGPKNLVEAPTPLHWGGGATWSLGVF